MCEPRGPHIALEAATRRFGDLVAVDAVDLELVPRRIHALIGENGAGKSTALKLVAGHLPPSEGRVLIGGAVLTPARPDEAIRRGVGMVHQHFMLVDRMSALENLVLGAEPVRGPFALLDLATARRRAEEIAEQNGLSLRLDARADELSVGERQRLEILRVLFRGARAVLLDEPTAVLSPVEVGELYATLRRLADGGATVAVVTHRLDEVVRYCDRVTVMRRGAVVLDGDLHELAASMAHEEMTAHLTRAIMGKEVPAPAEPPPLGDDDTPVLRLRALTLWPSSDGAIDLSVRAGEVVGVAGVEGNGQRELVRILTGLDPCLEGSVEIDDWRAARHGDVAERVRTARRAGLVVVHEDRHRDELLLGQSVADNLVLGDLGALADDEATVMNRRFRRFEVYPPDAARLAEELSGGNQQKVVMARALDRSVRVLVLAQPTRGVDIGTARTIQRAVADVAREGAAVVIISADLAELRSLCHRIVVLRKGAIAAELPPDASDEKIGRAMLGLEEPA